MSETSRGVLLIVDDEPLKCATLRIDLSSAGYTVLEAADAATGLKHLAEKQVNVVVTDLRMPGMDGLEFLQQIKAHSPHTHVIVMTAFGTVDSAVEAMRSGAYDYITKPFASQVLIDKIERLQAITPVAIEPAATATAQPDLDQILGRVIAFTGSDNIKADQFVPATSGATARSITGLTETIAGVERTLIDAALRRAAGNQARAAQFLRIPRTTLRDKMAKYGMVSPEVKPQLPS